MPYESLTVTARNRWNERLGAAWAFTFGFSGWMKRKEDDLTTPLRRHYEVAELIMAKEGSAFARAATAGIVGDLQHTRMLLKRAISEALAVEFTRVHENTLAGALD